MRFRRLGYLTLTLLLLATPGAQAAALRTLPNLVEVKVWERTGGDSPNEFTFQPSGPELTTRLPDPLTAQNSDFAGAATEYYDVYFSDADGTFNPDGEFLTVSGVWGRETGGGGFNLAEVALVLEDGTVFGDTVISFRALGINAAPGNVGRAVDGNLLSHTTMGNTVSANERLRVTISFDPAGLGSGVPVFSSSPPPSSVFFASTLNPRIPDIVVRNGGTVGLIISEPSLTLVQGEQTDVVGSFVPWPFPENWDPISSPFFPLSVAPGTTQSFIFSCPRQPIGSGSITSLRFETNDPSRPEVQYELRCLFVDGIVERVILAMQFASDRAVRRTAKQAVDSVCEQEARFAVSDAKPLIVTNELPDSLGGGVIEFNDFTGEVTVALQPIDGDPNHCAVTVVEGEFHAPSVILPSGVATGPNRVTFTDPALSGGQIAVDMGAYTVYATGTLTNQLAPGGIPIQGSYEGTFDFETNTVSVRSETIDDLTNADVAAAQGGPPSLGVGRTLLPDGPLLRSPSLFAGGVAIGNAAPRHAPVVAQADTIRVAAKVEVDPDHVGQHADLLAVVLYTVPQIGTVTLMKSGSSYLVWDGKLNTLAAAESNVTLSADMDINVFSGALTGLPAGQFAVFVGYRLADETIVFNGSQAILFSLADK